MIDMIYARWLLIKRQLPKISLWLIVPVLLTLVVTNVFNSTREDFRVPAAVVVHESSAEANIFIEGLKSSEFMAVEVFNTENSTAAIRELEQYRLDSVFILPEDFAEKIHEGQRRDLIETYYTDRSIYYEQAKELAASLVQERMGEYTTVDYVLELQNNLLAETAVTAEDVAAERKRTETDTNLLKQVFYFLGESADIEETPAFHPWIVWAYITFTVTIFIFDFVTRETVSSTRTRFYFMKHSYTNFMLLTLVIMTAVMLIVDSITYVIIKEVLTGNISFLSLVMFRIVINGIAFLLASSVKSPVKLYQAAVALTIALLALQLAMPAIISLTGLSLMSSLHPVLMFIENELNISWIILIAVLMLIWVWRDNNAGS
ncbi:hypothetical protein [Jeotgalicoccus psychrophilus]|uniref:hypothetical protein n=1 Tax=Jeotgalicoccus psychrophilus TaxID=157228 RepID=UPI0003F9B21D|nr:hypothetical protein [Jeotgalicoccus psychrophilus]